MIVSWKPRQDGKQPKESAYTNKELLEINPKMLAQFYESKLKFVP